MKIDIFIIKIYHYDMSDHDLDQLMRELEMFMKSKKIKKIEIERKGIHE